MIRPFDQLRKIARGKARYVDDGDPMETPPISGGLHPRDIGQLDKAIRRNSCAETPPFRLAGLEIGEFLSAHGVDEEIVRLSVHDFASMRKAA